MAASATSSGDDNCAKDCDHCAHFTNTASFALASCASLLIAWTHGGLGVPTYLNFLTTHSTITLQPVAYSTASACTSGASKRK